MKKWFLLSSVFLLHYSNIFCSTYAIAGGADNGFNNGYLALVSSTGATSFPIGLTEAAFSIIHGVAINPSSAAIIGGSGVSGTPFFALISPGGKALIPTSGANFPIGAGEITAVAINSKGAAIIGGAQNGSNDPYAALLSSAGILTGLTGSLPTPTGSIDAVAINDKGFGIISGSDSGLLLPYVGLVAPDGFVTALTAGSQPLPSGFGEIFGVAINAVGTSILGGYDNGFATPYVAFVSSEGQTAAIAGSGLPVGDGRILSVDINDSGNAIIGGQDNGFQDAYAALIDSSGVATAITGAQFPASGTGSQINSVAINSSGAAVIGGLQNGLADPYAVLVFPNNKIVSLSGDVPQAGGFIQTVAINEAGVAMLGGVDNGLNDVYLAVVSPSGVATKLSGAVLPIGSGVIKDVAIGPTIPSSWGPGSSFANTIFAFSSDLLPNHMHWHQRAPREKTNAEVGLLADASPWIRHKSINPHTNYSVWGSVLGDYAHQKKNSKIPAWTQWLGGAFLGFDYWGLRDMLFGCGAGYAYSHVTMSETGHANSNQEFVTFYGSLAQKIFYIDWAVWGGFYQLSNERVTIAPLTATANTKSWFALPHFELGFPFSWEKFAIIPFGMIDWANDWQDSVHEKGRSGLNLIISSQYTSLLRSEIGLRLFQIFRFNSGDFLLKEKASYVNKAPFHAAPVATFFVGSISSFTIDIFNRQMDNLGAVEFGLEYVPRKSRWPYVALDYQGEFGSSFQTHFLSLEIGKDF